MNDKAIIEFGFVIVIVIVIARIGHSPWGFSGPILQYFLRLLGEIGRQLI